MASIDVIGPDGARIAPDGRGGRRAPAPKGSRYIVRYRTPEGHSRMRSFAKRVEAEQFLATTEHQKAAGEYVDASAGRVTFAAYAASWAAAQPHRASTAASVEGILRSHVLPSFGSRQIATIRASEIQAWVAGLELAPSTVAVVYGKVAAIFRAAEEDRVIARSPCTRRIRLPRPSGGEVVPMAPEQVRAMVEAVSERYGALVILLAGSGLRPGEALGLTVDRVDSCAERSASIASSSRCPTSRHVFGSAKTTSSVRTIPVPQVALDELARHLEHHSPGPHGLIFTDSKGDPIRRNALGHIWRRAAARAGVEGFTPHDLRHYAASVLIDQGASVKAVQRHLGHASATTTLDTYAHLWPESEEVTRQALSAGLSRVVLPVCDPGGAEAAK